MARLSETSFLIRFRKVNRAMNSDAIWLLLGAGGTSGLVGGLMSFRKDRWIIFVIAIGAGMMGGILSNRLLMLTEAVAPRLVLIDSNGATRAELALNNDDSAFLRLMDGSGNERDPPGLVDLRGSNAKLLWSSDPAQSTAAGPMDSNER